MSGSDEFRHWPASDGAGLAASVSVFADRPALRDQMAEDLADAGFRLVNAGEVAALLDGELAALGDVVLLDCPMVDAGTMAALARLDMRVARSGAQLIVSTSLEALDDVFACFDQSQPQILVDPGRAERVVAVGRILGHLAGRRVRELSREDRAALLQLTQQVDAIARQLEGLRSRLGDDEGEPKHLGARRSAFRGFADSSRVEKLAKPGLPEARLVREIIRHRQARAKFFDAALFADPAWDMRSRRFVNAIHFKEAA